MSRNISPVAGAASYSFCADAGKWIVVMDDTEGHRSTLQNCATVDAAEKAADKWQKKENAAVSRASKP